MYVTQHAAQRMVERVGVQSARLLTSALEGYDGEYGTVAYLLALPEPVTADDGSNGNVLVAIAVDGSVETLYFRRSGQDLSAHYFGARAVHDMRARLLRSGDLTPRDRVNVWARQRRRSRVAGGVR